MENSANESRNENRIKTNVASLIAFFSFFVVATFLYIINPKSNNSSSVLLQKYLWNFQLLQNLIATLFINGFLCIILLIFRKYGKVLLWCIHTILMMTLLINIVGMGLLMLKDTIYTFFFWLPFLLFIVVICVYGLLVYKNRVSINLVSEFIGESMKGLDGVKFLVLIPILNSLLLIIPMNVYYLAYESVKDKDYSFTVIWITAAFILFLFFMDEFQKFLVAGVTTKCYFTRDKNNFGRPILETLTLLIKFHLGSVCYGAMIKFFKPFFKFTSHSLNVLTFSQSNRTTIVSISNWFEAHTASNNAYVLISRDGIPYYESGKKLFILLSKDLINTTRIKNTKIMTIFIVKLFLWSVVVAIQALIIENDHNSQKWAISNVEVCITLVYTFCMVSNYVDYIKIITNTTIIAACLDYDTNDGTTKPYYMSKSLEDFIRRIKLGDEPQMIITERFSPPQITQVPQTTVKSTVYGPYQLIPVQNS